MSEQETSKTYRKEPAPSLKRELVPPFSFITQQSSRAISPTGTRQAPRKSADSTFCTEGTRINPRHIHEGSLHTFRTDHQWKINAGPFANHKEYSGESVAQSISPEEKLVVDPIRLLLKREAPRGPDPFPPARGSTMKFYRGVLRRISSKSCSARSAPPGIRARQHSTVPTEFLESCTGTIKPQGSLKKPAPYQDSVLHRMVEVKDQPE